MVHKNYKWNISKEEGKEIALRTIYEILSEQKNNSIELNELIFLLNSRTKSLAITNNKKKKNIVNFLKTNFGGIKIIIKDSEELEILNDENKSTIRKIDATNFLELNDWILIDDSDD